MSKENPDVVEMLRRVAGNDPGAAASMSAFMVYVAVPDDLAGWSRLAEWLLNHAPEFVPWEGVGEP